MQKRRFEIILGDKNVVLARIELRKTFVAEARPCKARSNDRVVGDRADSGAVQHQPSYLRRER